VQGFHEVIVATCFDRLVALFVSAAGDTIDQRAFNSAFTPQLSGEQAAVSVGQSDIKKDDLGTKAARFSKRS
jgi:hypothetical protein